MAAAAPKVAAVVLLIQVVVVQERLRAVEPVEPVALAS
jgi:hypothetical protein